MSIILRRTILCNVMVCRLQLFSHSLP